LRILSITRCCFLNHQTIIKQIQITVTILKWSDVILNFIFLIFTTILFAVLETQRKCL